MIWGQGRVPFWEGDCSLGHPVNVACKGCPSLAMAWLPLLLRPPGARHNGPLTVPALIQSSWSRFLDKGPRGRAFTETSRGSHLGAASAQMWRSREWGRQISRQGILGRPFRRSHSCASQEKHCCGQGGQLSVFWVPMCWSRWDWLATKEEVEIKEAGCLLVCFLSLT